MIDCSWGLFIYEKLHIAFVEETTFGFLSYLLFTFWLFFFPPILSHQSILCYFVSGEVDSRIRIRIPSGGFILHQSHLILLQCQNTLFLHFFNSDDCLFPHIVLFCIFGDIFTLWFLPNLWLEDNHRIISPSYLYLNSYKCFTWYLVYLFRLGSSRYLDGFSTCLGISCWLGRD